MYMTIDDFIRKVNNVLKAHPEINRNAVITDSMLVERDCEYPQGTLLFKCIDDPNNPGEEWHELSIYPDRLSKFLN